MKSTWRTLAVWLAAGTGLALAAPEAFAAYSCSVTVTGVGVIYTAANVDTNGTVTLTCTRDPLVDPSPLSYRIKADNGLNFSAGTRRVKRGAFADVLTYTIRRGSEGGAAVCNNASNWSAPAGSANTIQGSLTFAAGAATASTVWGFCIRVRGAPPNPAAPAAGVYTDTMQVFAQYPGTNGSPLTPSAGLTYTVGVGSQCVFNTPPLPMVFNYTAFSATPQVVTRNFDLRCSSGLPWSVAIAPAAGTILGLNYTMVPSPGTGTGTGADQVITNTGTIAAGQAGTCSLPICSATVPHTVTITY